MTILESFRDDICIQSIIFIFINFSQCQLFHRHSFGASVGDFADHNFASSSHELGAGVVKPSQWRPWFRDLDPGHTVLLDHLMLGRSTKISDSNYVMKSSHWELQGIFPFGILRNIRGWAVQVFYMNRPPRKGFSQIRWFYWISRGPTETVKTPSLEVCS